MGDKENSKDQKDGPQEQYAPKGGKKDIYGHDEIPIPLVFVPGIGGSKLGIQKNLNGKPLKTEFFWPPSSLYDTDLAVDKLKDGLKSKEIVADDLFPGAYDELLSGLKAMGYELNVNFWIYAYDWTKSNKVSGAGLKAFIDDILSKHPEWKKVDVINHSMGGLVTRAAYGDGAKILRMIFITSPHYGSPNAYFFLNPNISSNLLGTDKISGLTGIAARLAARYFNVDKLEKEVKDIVRTFQSVYELLCDRYYFELGLKKYIVFHDGYKKKERITDTDRTYFDSDKHWGLPKDRHSDVQNALDFKAKIQYSVPGDPKDTLVIYSNSEATDDVITWAPGKYKGGFKDRKDDGQKGDGTVSTESARDFKDAVSIKKVKGTHSAIPNSDDTIIAIREFLTKPPNKP